MISLKRKICREQYSFTTGSLMSPDFKSCLSVTILPVLMYPILVR